jgi:abequosyltransferase
MSLRHPLISICIPTYNFGQFIGETLASILSQVEGMQEGMGEGLEVLVVDGSSTDGTSGILAALERQHPALRYIRLPEKGGIDKDMAIAVEQARGEYCWIFGADDLMAKGALAEARAQVESGEDVYLCETTLCTLQMRPVHRYRNLSARHQATFDLADSRQRQRYFSLALNTQAFFSFCGALIVNRRRWMETPCEPAFMGSCWGHVARIFGMIPRGLRVKHVPLSWSKKRGGNDSFIDQGIVNRIRIGIAGFLAIGDHFFGPESFESREIARCLRAEFTLPYFMGIRCESEEMLVPEKRAKLSELFCAIRRSDSLRTRLERAVFLHAPVPLMRVILRAGRGGKALLRNVRSNDAEGGLHAP